MSVRSLRLLVVASCLFGMLPASAATAQNDGGTGSDAGDSFATATPLASHGRFAARLDRAAGDADDYFSFALSEGEAFSVLVSFGAPTTDPVELLDPNGIPLDEGARASGTGVAVSNAFTAASTAFSPSDEVSQVRVSVQRALVAGAYRLHVQSHSFAVDAYSLCVMNCDGIVAAPIEMIFGGSLRTTQTRVLLIPPSHGDLGNPSGPTVLDYIDATLKGIHTWKRVMADFARDYPPYAYLTNITVDVEIFDGAKPVDPAGYDVIIGYIAAGPAFRGVASDADDNGERILAQAGVSRSVHYSGRVIALSLFGSSPRAGQVLYDFPEVLDLQDVTTHEFAHTFGLGHTTTWDATLGYDIMNSPAPFIYGDGSTVGDGGERTPLKCISTLDLYGMAVLYRWIPSGTWTGTSGTRTLPAGIPYTLYC